VKTLIVVIALFVLVGVFVSPTLVVADGPKYVIASNQQTAQPGASFNIDTLCTTLVDPKSEVVTGGYEILSPDISSNLSTLDITVYSNTFHFAFPKADGWQTIGKNQSPYSITVRVLASCTKPGKD
jgi:hypothetical protein